MTVGVALLVAVMGVAVVAFGAAASMGLSTVNVIASMTHLALLALVFGTVALLVGAATGRVILARAVAAGLAVIAYLLNGLGLTVSWLSSARRFSPFFQYVGHDPIREGFSPSSLVIAVTTVAVLVAAAVPLFTRRDLKG